MSQINNNALLHGISGMLGKLVVFRKIRGKLVVSNRPKKAAMLTDHQKKMKGRFLRAVQYAKTQMENAEAKAEYATRISPKNHSAFHVALTDYLTAPEIKVVNTSRYTGKAGDVILIRASDDFKVVSVHVIIRNDDGVVVEEGDARFQPGSLDEWRFVADVANTRVEGCTIEVKACDNPGNATTAKSLM